MKARARTHARTHAVCVSKLALSIVCGSRFHRVASPSKWKWIFSQSKWSPKKIKTDSVSLCVGVRARERASERMMCVICLFVFFFLRALANGFFCSTMFCITSLAFFIGALCCLNASSLSLSHSYGMAPCVYHYVICMCIVLFWFRMVSGLF